MEGTRSYANYNNYLIIDTWIYKDHIKRLNELELILSIFILMDPITMEWSSGKINCNSIRRSFRANLHLFNWFFLPLISTFYKVEATFSECLLKAEILCTLWTQDGPNKSFIDPIIFIG